MPWKRLTWDWLTDLCGNERSHKTASFNCIQIASRHSRKYWPKSVKLWLPSSLKEQSWCIATRVIWFVLTIDPLPSVTGGGAGILLWPGWRSNAMQLLCGCSELHEFTPIHLHVWSLWRIGSDSYISARPKDKLVPFSRRIIICHGGSANGECPTRDRLQQWNWQFSFCDCDNYLSGDRLVHLCIVFTRKRLRWFCEPFLAEVRLSSVQWADQEAHVEEETVRSQCWWGILAQDDIQDVTPAESGTNPCEHLPACFTFAAKVPLKIHPIYIRCLAP